MHTEGEARRIRRMAAKLLLLEQLQRENKLSLRQEKTRERIYGMFLKSQQPTAGEDRRISLRLHAPFEARVSLSNSTRVCNAHNLSLGGVCIDVPAVQREPDNLIVVHSLNLRHSVYPLNVRAAVRWIGTDRTLGGELLAWRKVGLKFLWDNRADRDALLKKIWQELYLDFLEQLSRPPSEAPMASIARW